MGVLQHLETYTSIAVSSKTVERSKLPLVLFPKVEPRQLKSLGTDAFIASGSFLNRMYCDKGVRSRQKKLVALSISFIKYEFHGSIQYSVYMRKQRRI